MTKTTNAVKERENQRLLSLALGAAEVGTWNDCPSIGVFAWNDRCKAIFGLAADAPVDFESFVALVHPDDRKRAQEGILRCLNAFDGARCDIEFRIVRPDGAVRWILVRGCSVCAGARSKERRFIGAVIDVTDYVLSQRRTAARVAELERRVRERTLSARLLDEELDAFACSTSHNLRGPLRRILLLSETILAGHAASLDAKGREYFGSIRAASKEMNVIIDDILTLTRVVRTKLKLEKLDLSELARDLVPELLRRAPGRRVEFVIEPRLAARGDRILMKTALRSLLDNAVKFTAGRGRARVEVGAQRHAEHMAYFVRDNGAGFDMRYAEKLFRPFERLHPAGEFPGTGIGLRLFERIIRRHEGRVWASARTGEGAAFFFTLFSERAQ
ncbi:MAG: PAS domain-containing protein [Elusimicrobia bacterium]|nr:PAS domain-containing protein [Elusimicrobiota bacterium]